MSELIIYFSIKESSKITVCSRGGSKHGDISFNRILGIEIQVLSMNLMSCHGYLNNLNSFGILKCP